MANVGTLTVNLEASLATFQRDLGKAVNMAESSARQITSAFRSIVGSLAGGIGFKVFLDATRDIIHAAAALDDLSDATGSSVESLSRLANQAKISGVDFATLQGLMLKLSVGLAGVEEKGSNVGRALQYLGVQARDPAQALNEVAVKLSQYADGVGKAALARDLFGKGGPAFLATLKDIAEAQDVQATVTAKQAAEAEQLEKALRRLSVESGLFRDAILSDVVPALNNVIARFRLAREAGEGLFGAFLRAGTNVDTLPEQINATAKEVEFLTKAVAAGKRNPLPDILKISEADLSAAKAKLASLKSIYGQFLVASQGDNSDQVSRATGRKPVADYTGAAADKAARATREAMSEAERYLRSLEDQLQKTKELSVEETLLSDIERGRLKLSGTVSLERLQAVARQIDAAKELKKTQEEQNKQLQEEARLRETTSRMTTRAQEAAGQRVQGMAAANQDLRDEVDLIGADAAAHIELAKARLASSIATEEERLAALQNADGSKIEIAFLEDEIRLLKERYQILTQKGIAEQLLRDAQVVKQYNDIFIDSFADSAASVSTRARTMKEAINDMERSIVASISRIAAHNIGEAIFGKTGQGGMGSMVASLFGTGGGSGASNPFADMFVHLFGAAGGTNFAPGGLTLVGERGPEVVNLPRGAQVIPNDVLMARRGERGGHTINNYINVLPGASTRTGYQAALQTGIETGRAIRRNG